MKMKEFDAVEMKREGSRQVYEEIRLMTRDDQVTFWQEKTEEMKESQMRLREEKDKG